MIGAHAELVHQARLIVGAKQILREPAAGLISAVLYCAAPVRAVRTTSAKNKEAMMRSRIVIGSEVTIASR